MAGIKRHWNTDKVLPRFVRQKHDLQYMQCPQGNDFKLKVILSHPNNANEMFQQKHRMNIIVSLKSSWTKKLKHDLKNQWTRQNAAMIPCSHIHILHPYFQQPDKALSCHAIWCTPTLLCFPLHIWLFSWHFWVCTVVQAWNMHIDDHLTWIAYIWTHRKKWHVSSPPQSN